MIIMVSPNRPFSSCRALTWTKIVVMVQKWIMNLNVFFFYKFQCQHFCSSFFFFISFFSLSFFFFFEYRGPSKSRLIHEIIRENEVTALNRSTSTSIERDRGFMATKRCDVPFSPPSDDVDTEEYKKCHPRNSKKTHRART